MRPAQSAASDGAAAGGAGQGTLGGYEAGLQPAGMTQLTRGVLAPSGLRRNVYVAESNAQAEDELSALVLQTRAHMVHACAEYNPANSTIDRRCKSFVSPE